MTVKLTVRQIITMGNDLKLLADLVGQIRAYPDKYPEELQLKASVAVDGCHRLKEIHNDLLNSEVSVKG